MFNKSNTVPFAVKVNTIKSSMPEAQAAFHVIDNAAYTQSGRSIPMSALTRRVEETKKPREQVEKLIKSYADLVGVEVN